MPPFSPTDGPDTPSVVTAPPSFSFDHVTPSKLSNSELAQPSSSQELKQLSPGAISQLENRTACQLPSVVEASISEHDSDAPTQPFKESTLFCTGTLDHASTSKIESSILPLDAPARGVLRNACRSPDRALSPSHSNTSTPCLPEHAPIHSCATESSSDHFLNQLVIEPIETPTEFTIRDIKHMKDVDEKPYGLANIKIGLHATETALPSWQYALLDSGCTDNLVSLKSLQAMADFASANISTSTAKTLRTANNDQCQIILGRVTILLSLIDQRNRRICFRVPFLVVSGLTHDIFLGQPFLTSGHILKETRSALHFASELSGDDPFIIPKIYLTRRKAVMNKRTIVPPRSAAKVATNLISRFPLNDELFATFRPSDRFLTRYPSLHIPYQTIPSDHEDHISVFVINVTDQPIAIKHSAPLGFYETLPKHGTLIHSLSDFLPSDRAPVNSDRLFSLNDLLPTCYSLVSEPENTDDSQTDEFVDCNAAYTASLHEHELTQQEKDARRAFFNHEGYFQKSVTEVINQNAAMPSFTYAGASQFDRKTDDQLLSTVELSHLSPEHQKLTLDMLRRNIHAFQRHDLDIGCCTSVTAYAPLNTQDPPILYTKYVPIPAKYKKPAQALIDAYVQAGVLAPTTEPCKFTSNVFVIPKRNGTFRLIFDGRLVSKYCQALPLSLGNLDELFSNLSGKTLVSKLDVSQAYYQIGITKETSQLLSFFGPDSKRYVFLRTGQGLKFSSFFMSQMMDTVLFDIPEANHYCDDVFLASSQSFPHHLGLLEKVIQAFNKHNVRLNIAKLEIAPPTLDFLGLTWSKNKLSIPKSKITGYLNLKKPTSLKQVRFLVNSMAFYRRFLPRFSHHINPLLELLKENPKKFIWTDTHQQAVDTLVSIIEKGVSLYLPQFDKPFLIHTDASYCALGATVSQYDKDGHLRLVAAVSRSFVKSERRLAPVQKEVLGLLYTLTSLHYLLKGHKLVVYADARSLTLLKTCSASSPYLARLAMELSSFDFELYHLEGNLNLEADALSRLHKMQDKILDNDKLINDSMTKEESLLFLEFLKIPNDYRFTVSEVRHMLTSEPLRTQLKQKIKARHAGCVKTTDHNSPTTMKSKKVHEPRYTSSHPLERAYRLPDRTKSPKRLSRRSSPSAHAIQTENIFKKRVHFASPLVTLIPNDRTFVPHSPCINEYKSPIMAPQATFPPIRDLTLDRPHTPQDVYVSHVPTLDDLSPFSSSDNSPTSSGRSSPDLSLPFFSADVFHTDTGLVDSTLTEQLTQPCHSASCVVHNCSGTRHPPDENDLCHTPPLSPLTTVSESSSLPFRPSLPMTDVFVLNSSVGVPNSKLCDTLEELKQKSQIITTGLLTAQEFCSAQELDPAIMMLKETYVPEMQHLHIDDDGILQRKTNSKFLPYLPAHLESFLFNCQHFHVLSGHRSADSMQKAIQEQFYVPNLKQKLLDFTRQCFICSLGKSKKMQKTVQGTTRQSLFPKHILSFDIFGAVQPDSQGHRYVYSFIDNFSLFVINFKAKTRTTEEILAAFLHVFAIFSSLPEIVCSDQEPALMSPKAQSFFSSFGIKQNTSASHSHWRLLSEGASIRKTKDFLRSVLLSNPTSDWAQALQLATFALNNTPTQFKYTPLQLFYGNSKNQLNLFQTAAKFTNLDDYVQNTSRRYNDLIDAVNYQRKISIEERNAAINEHRKLKSFSVGSLVWLKSLNISPHRATKLQNLGPFIILQQINPFTFKLATLEQPTKCARISHASHLEPFHNDANMTHISFPSPTT